VILLSQLSEEPLNLLTLVSSMPCLRHVLEACLGETVAIMVEKASQSHPITKLNSRLEVERSLVDHVLDLYRFHGLTPIKKVFGCQTC